MRALITGITGQLGPFMAQLLLSKGYEVFGLKRRNSKEFRLDNLQFILPEKWEEVEIVLGDLTDSASLIKVIRDIEPDLIFNYAAQSHVGQSWEIPISTSEITGLGVLRLLEAIRAVDPQIRLWQASSSEMFGNSPPPQNEKSPMQPASPYAISKLFAHQMIQNYRDSFDLKCCAGIQFNCESEIRGAGFVTRKICQAAAQIYAGKQNSIQLGNLEAKRDWSFAGDCVEAHYKMILQDQLREYVIGSGETHTVREFAERAFSYLDLDFYKFLKIDQTLFRPVEVRVLQADPQEIKRDLKWKPKLKFDDLIRRMVDAELKRL